MTDLWICPHCKHNCSTTLDDAQRAKDECLLIAYELESELENEYVLCDCGHWYIAPKDK